MSSAAAMTPAATAAVTSPNGVSAPHARSHSTSSQSGPSSDSPQSPELFTSDEARFMTESLTSAESFDPFTVGAPGFKVPALLPSSFAVNAPPPQQQQQSTQQQQQHQQNTNGNAAAGASSSPAARAAAPAATSLPPFAFPYSQRSVLHSASSSSHQNGMTIAAGNSLNTSSELANYGIASHPLPHARSSLFDAAWLSTAQGRATTAAMPDVDMPYNSSSASGPSNGAFYSNADAMSSFMPGSATADANALLMRAQGIMGAVYGSGGVHHARSGSAPHGSQQGAQQPFSSGVAFGGYGKDKQWQMEQLSFLQRVEQSRSAGGAAEMNGHGTRTHTGDASASDVEMSRNDSNSSGPMSLSNSVGELPNGAPRKGLRHAASSNDLGMLGLTFPSSHNFAAPGGSGAGVGSSTSTSRSASSSGEQRPGMSRAATTAIGTGVGAAAYASASAPPTKTSFDEPSKSRTGSVAPASAGGSARGKGKATAAAKSGRPATTANDSNAPTSFGAAWLAHTKSLHSSSRGFKKPFVQVDLEKAKDSWRVPRELESAFFDAGEKQPHLVGYVERRDSESRSSQSPSASRKGKGPGDATSPDAGAAGSPDSAATPAPPPLLTDAQKKANHIASEQKRRANIRKGYEMLCEAVPSLREAVRREDARKGVGGSAARGGGDAGEDEMDELESRNATASGARKRSAPDDALRSAAEAKEAAGLAAAAGTAGSPASGSGSATPASGKPPSSKKKKDASGGVALKCEIAGERIDGRAGPRSEGIVLMKTVDYIRLLLDEHRDLLSRRNKARIEAARVWGIEGVDLPTNATLADSDNEEAMANVQGMSHVPAQQSDAMEH